MAFNRLEIEFLVRNTRFKVDGKMQHLKGDAGYNVVSETMMNDLINTAVSEVNMAIMDDKQSQVTNCVIDSDEIVPPADSLAISDVEIFPDYDDSSSPTGVSSYSSGLILKKSVSQGGLIAQQSVEYDHGVAIKGNNQSGKPSAWILWRRDNQDLIKFNIPADHGYYVRVWYWTIPASLTTDDATPEIKDIYQYLIIDLTRVEIANILGDDRAINRFELAYRKRLDRYRRAKNIDSRPKVGKTWSIYT